MNTIESILLDTIRKEFIGHTVEFTVSDIKVVAKNITNIDLDMTGKCIKVIGEIEHSPIGSKNVTTTDYARIHYKVTYKVLD